MNKKLFFLLPAAMLALTGCKLGAIEEPKNSEPTTSESSSSSSSSESSSSSSEDSSSSSSEDSSSSSSEDSSSSSSSESSSESSSSSEDTSSSEGGGGGDTTNYGTEEHPLSVTEALAICATECDDPDDVSTQRIYCVGVAESTPALNGTYGWKNFDIHDENDSSKKLTVWNPNKTTAFPQTTKFYQNDVVVVEGFIKNYGGVLEFTNTAASGQTRTDPTMVRIEEVGRSTISVTDDTHAQVGQIAATELNGETVSFSVIVDDGYSATVKVNGTTITPTDDVYSFVVEGDMSVVVTATEEGALVEKVAYTLDGNVKQGSGNDASNYAKASIFTADEVGWSAVANTQIQPWRIGGKGTADEDKVIKSTTAVSSLSIIKVEVEVGDMTISKFNSLTLTVGTAEGGSQTSTIAKTSVAKNSKIVFELPEGADWSSKYFTFTFNINCGNASSNKYLQLVGISFIYLG